MTAILHTSVQRHKIKKYSAHCVRVLMIALALSLKAACGQSSQASLDGFLTQNVSGSQLHLGALTLRYNDQTRCAMNELVRGTPFIRGIQIRQTPVKCSALSLTVGSYVHAIGSIEADANLTATEIESGRSWKGPQGHSASLLLRHWRYESYFSGGPFLGTLKGGAILEETPSEAYSAHGTILHLWINGFPLEVTNETKAYLALQGLTDHSIMLGSSAFVGGWTIASKSTPVVPPIASNFHPGTFVSYQGSRQDDKTLFATKLTLFSNRVTRKEKQFLSGVTPQIVEPNYVTHSPGSIQYKEGSAIKVIPYRGVQEYVQRIGMEVVPRFLKVLRASDLTEIRFRFYVVRPFENVRANQFVQIEGLDPTSIPKGSWGEMSPFVRPSDHILLDTVVTMPDGTILIPDSALSRLSNQAQLAFVLSAAVQSTVQRQAYIAARLMNAKGADFIPPKGISRLETQQAMRLSIRQMYTAGYDIREAPFAWSVELGEPATNPVMDATNLDEAIPWYAEYAFNYISHYYGDVDYSKLKRGEAEYQQFLKELRVADPEAFAGK